MKEVQMHSCMRHRKQRVHILLVVNDFFFDFSSVFQQLLLHWSWITSARVSLQTLIVPACLHSFSGFTARLINLPQEFKSSTESLTCTVILAFTPCTCKWPIITLIWAQHNKDAFFAVVLLLDCSAALRILQKTSVWFFASRRWK